MSQYKAFSSNVEVNGETVLSVVEGVGAFKTSAIKTLQEAGIENPTPGKWYRQQAWLDAFRKIAESIGQNTLLQIGRKIPQAAKFPPEIDNVEKALASIDIAYHMNHRGGDIGNYKFEKTAPNVARIICKNPYPCNFDKGIIQAMAERFRPSGSIVSVTHADDQPCRNKGGDSCTFVVKW